MKKTSKLFVTFLCFVWKFYHQCAAINSFPHRSYRQFGPKSSGTWGDISAIQHVPREISDNTGDSKFPEIENYNKESVNHNSMRLNQANVIDSQILKINLQYILQCILDHPVFFSWLSLSDIESFLTLVRKSEFILETTGSQQKLNDESIHPVIRGTDLLQIFKNIFSNDSDSVQSSGSSVDVNDFYKEKRYYAMLKIINNSVGKIMDQLNSAEFSLNIIHKTLNNAYPKLFSTTKASYNLVNDILLTISTKITENSYDNIGFFKTKFDICPVNDFKIHKGPNLNVNSTTPATLELSSITSTNNYSGYEGLVTDTPISTLQYTESQTLYNQDDEYQSTTEIAYTYPEKDSISENETELTTIAYNVSENDVTESQNTNTLSSSPLIFQNQASFAPTYVQQSMPMPHYPFIHYNYPHSSQGIKQPTHPSMDHVGTLGKDHKTKIENNYNFEINLDNDDRNLKKSINGDFNKIASSDLLMKMQEMIDLLKNVFGEDSRVNRKSRTLTLRKNNRQTLTLLQQMDKNLVNYIVSIIGENIISGRSSVQKNRKSKMNKRKGRKFSFEELHGLKSFNVFPFNSREFPVYHLPSTYRTEISTNQERTFQEALPSYFNTLGNTESSSIHNISTFLNPSSFRSLDNLHIPLLQNQNFVPVLLPYPVPVPTVNFQSKDSLNVFGEFQPTNPQMIYSYIDSNSNGAIKSGQLSTPNSKEMFSTQPSKAKLYEPNENVSGDFDDKVEKGNTEFKTGIKSEDFLGSRSLQNRKKSKFCRKVYFRLIASLKKIIESLH